jgi:dGTPase
VVGGFRQAHAGPGVRLAAPVIVDRASREAMEDGHLAAGATRAQGAGRRPREEEPDPWRTCYERDRDRILHSTAFRRLAGKTQVFVFPADHQRTRLTHALEVAQVARAISRALGLNEALSEAIALGHDCGHGPFGHASEDALDPLVPGGFDHAPWGADITLASLNLTREVSDGIRNHSWSRPAPTTPEGEVCSIADRVSYTTHDAEDAARAHVVDLQELPRIVRERLGTTRSAQLEALVQDAVVTSQRVGVVGMSEDVAEALASLRSWNYERIYLRDDSAFQARAVQRLLEALVEFYIAHPGQLPEGSMPGVSPEHQAVTYVAGMTDRFACMQASALLGWPPEAMPAGFDT